MSERVILLDENNNEIGTEEKMNAHREGKLHRAFSIFVFNPKGEMLIHKRAKGKYHCEGLWTNTCCSHPRPGEITEEAVHRRLKEEMGLDCNLNEIFSFTYKIKFDNGLFEHEHDHVFTGVFDGEPKPDPEEVEEWKWVSTKELLNDIKENPGKYTYWFKEAVNRVVSHGNAPAN